VRLYVVAAVRIGTVVKLFIVGFKAARKNILRGKINSIGY
jgi:hypothetical protein